MDAEKPPYYHHLANDPVLFRLLQSKAPRKIDQQNNVCLRLCASIMSQQLSTKVADIIYNRFLSLFEGTEPSPQQILQCSVETLRSIGLSNAKSSYIKNVAQYFIDNNLTDEVLHNMPDAEVKTLLTNIKGVGKWTVEMLLMFTLHREDVFAVDDLGIMQGMVKLYQLPTENKRALRAQMQAIATKWSQYSTYACLLIWDYKDNVSI